MACDLSVARVTKWMDLSDGHSVDVIRDSPVWVVIDEHLSVVNRKYGDPTLNFLSHTDGDEWEINPDCEWPEWVCVYLAKRALIGDK